MTTAIVISLIILVVAVGALGSRVSRLDSAVGCLRNRNDWLEADLVAAHSRVAVAEEAWRTELEALAGVVAANAKRTDSLEADHKVIDRLRGELADAKIDISNLELDAANSKLEATNLVSSALYRASLAVKPQAD